MFQLVAALLTLAPHRVCVESTLDRLQADEVVAALDARIDYERLRVATCRPGHPPQWRLIIAPETGGVRLTLVRSGHLIQRIIELLPTLPNHVAAQLVALAAAEALEAPTDMQLPGWLTVERPSHGDEAKEHEEPTTPLQPIRAIEQPTTTAGLALVVGRGVAIEPEPTRASGGGEARLAYTRSWWAVGGLVAYRDFGSVDTGSTDLDGGHLTLGLDGRWLAGIVELSFRVLARMTHPTSGVLRRSPCLTAATGT